MLYDCCLKILSNFLSVNLSLVVEVHWDSGTCTEDLEPLLMLSLPP